MLKIKNSHCIICESLIRWILKLESLNRDSSISLSPAVAICFIIPNKKYNIHEEGKQFYCINWRTRKYKLYPGLSNIIHQIYFTSNICYVLAMTHVMSNITRRYTLYNPMHFLHCMRCFFFISFFVVAENILSNTSSESKLQEWKRNSNVDSHISTSRR